MTDYCTNRLQILQQITQVLQQNNRPTQQVQLLAVSKTQPAAVIRQMAATGQTAFAENYLQEALAKQTELQDLALDWHFIGQIQRNKTKPIAENFAWAHGVDRLIIAERLSAQRPTHLPPLNICIQINVDDEASKGGCQPNELHDLVQAISQLPHLALRGVMIIPEKNSKQAFIRTKALFDSACSTHAQPELWDTLSMGMSADYLDAITAGATMVRVGTALFGERSYHQWIRVLNNPDATVL